MANEFNPRILGDYLKKTVAGDFVLVEVIHPSSSVIPRHIHDYINITLTLNGSSTQNFRGQSREYLPGSIAATPPGEVHSDLFGDAGARCLHIKVNPKRTEAIAALNKILEQPVYIQAGHSAIIVRKIYNELRCPDDVSTLAIESLLLELIVYINRTLSKKTSHAKLPPWLGTAKEFIHEYFDKQISLDDVADSVGINAAHLARMFRKHYRFSVGEYVRRLRLDFAARQLSKSELTLIEIATTAGFYDQSHFSHAFKSHSGITPAEFRNMLKLSKPDTKNT